MTFCLRPAVKPPGGVGLHRQYGLGVLPASPSLPGVFSLGLGATKLILLEALKEVEKRAESRP